MKTSIDDAFLDLLICPATRHKLRRLVEGELDRTNRRIAGGGIRMADGRVVDQPLTEALATEDGSRIYPVRDGIPVLLAEEAIVL